MPNRRNDGRPVVGEADAATRRAALRQHEEEASRDAKARLASKPKPQEKKPRQSGLPVEGIRGIDAVINRKRDLERQIDEAS